MTGIGNDSFETRMATLAQQVESAQRLLAERDAKIKDLEAERGQWRSRAENAEADMEAARMRLELLDAILDDRYDEMDEGEVREVLWDGPLEDAPGWLVDCDMLECVGDGFAWTPWGMALRHRFRQRMGLRP